jgi:hypothetical protein
MTFFLSPFLCFFLVLVQCQVFGYWDFQVRDVDSQFGHDHLDNKSGRFPDELVKRLKDVQ